MNLKLDYKKTAKVGLAFAGIMLFWTTYDFVIPLLIENAFGLSNTARGAVMGIDNLLSLFMLPLFGKLSDNCKSKYGRRKPFIVIGTLLAVVLMIFIPVSAQKQLNEATAVRNDVGERFATDAAFREETLTKWYEDAEAGKYDYISVQDFKIITGKDKLAGNKDKLTKEEYAKLAKVEIVKKKDGKFYKDKTEIAESEYKELKKAGAAAIAKKNGKFYRYETEITEAEYKSLDKTNVLYNKYVLAGQTTYTSEQVKANTDHKTYTARLVMYLVILFLVLIAMGTYRSPAVALMPDVTPKPLRSQANAIINLAGGVGGAISFLIYTIVLAVNPLAYQAVYLLVAGFMLLLLLLFCKLVDEPKMIDEKERICLEYGIAEDESFDDIDKVKAEIESEGETIVEEEQPEPVEDEKLKKAKFKSFLLILASIFMWFMGYNAVTSNMSVYATKVLGMSAGSAGLISGISMGISAVAFIPVGMLAVKIGRRKSIILGFALAVVSFLLIYLFLRPSGAVAVLFTLFYLISGFGLIIANVNTFPMVVELSKAGDVGRYTGFYYMATMSAQAITPFIAGLFMDNVSMRSLFLYSAVCVVAAIVLMALVKYGDSKPLPSKKSKLEQYGDLADSD